MRDTTQKDNTLTLSKYVTPGVKVEIQAIERVLLDDGSYGRKLYTSKVYDVIDEDRMEIFMPIEQTKLILLPVSGEYELHFFTPKGLYQCLARVTERYKSGNIYLLEMELISNLQKYQRREFYRYSCVQEMAVRALNDEEKSLMHRELPFEPQEGEYTDCTMVDISGGGIRLICPKAFSGEEHVICNFTLRINGVQKSYKVTSQVLACTELETQRGQFEHRLKFIRIENQEREEIIRYIFEEERKKRQRER